MKFSNFVLCLLEIFFSFFFCFYQVSQELVQMRPAGFPYFVFFCESSLVGSVLLVHRCIPGKPLVKDCKPSPGIQDPFLFSQLRVPAPWLCRPWGPPACLLPPWFFSPCSSSLNCCFLDTVPPAGPRSCLHGLFPSPSSLPSPLLLMYLYLMVSEMLIPNRCDLPFSSSFFVFAVMSLSSLVSSAV